LILRCYSSDEHQGGEGNDRERNVVKARAATTLAKLDYVPDVAVMGRL
jgi:hypothetical protein